MSALVELAPGAEENGFATMMGDLVSQNLESKPHKKKDFAELVGDVAIVVDDADVALTLSFRGGVLTIADGIVGIPHVTVRGPADAILALSNMPMTTSLGLPIPTDADARSTLRTLWSAARAGKFHIYGAMFHPSLVVKLGRVMSVHG